jgi:hypothetical protein
MSMVQPGESSTLLALTDVQPDWSRYEISLSADRSSYTTYLHEGLELSGLNSYRSGSTVYVVGLLRNNTGRTVRFAKVAVTLFDPTGSLVDYDYTYPFSSNDVAPGASSAFSVSFFDSSRSIPSGYTYVIDAEAWLTTSVARAAE